MAGHRSMCEGSVSTTSSYTLPSGPRKCCQVGPGSPKSSTLAARNSATASAKSVTSKADNRTSLKMLFTRVVPTEHLHMLPIGKFEDPKVRLGVHQIQPQHILIELCQSLGAITTRPAPAKTPYVHTRVWTTISRIVSPADELTDHRFVTVDAAGVTRRQVQPHS